MIVNNQEIVSQSRSSRSAFITKNGDHPTNDAVIHRFLSRLSQFTGFPVSHFEGMKVVNYQKGQEYLGHYDFFREHDNFTRVAGDRQLTFFVYLNTLDEKAGGCTSFPKLDLKIKPKEGDAVFWTNMDFKGFDNVDDAIQAAEDNAQVGHTAIVYKRNGKYFPYQVLIQQEKNWNPGDDKVITPVDGEPFEAFIVGRKQVGGHWAIRDRLA